MTYSATGNDATQASYLVTDKEWTGSGWPADAELLAYGSLGEPGESKTGTFELPDDCTADGWNESYYVYVLAEALGGGVATDYASVPVKVQLTEPEPATYKVAVDEGIQNGTVSVDKSEAAAGDPIKVTAEAAEGYELDTVTVRAADGTQVETKDGSFTMPASDVTVTATFTKNKEEKQEEPVAVPDASVTAHVQRIGWMDAVTDGGAAGTTGRSRRMEAVQLRLTGEAEKAYDVYYRVHVQRIGWMAWAKNGEEAGTQGMSRRAEAIQVVLVAKDAPAPDATYKGVTQDYDRAFVKK